MLGEDVAIDGGIRSKSFRGFDNICSSSWLSAFEPRIRYQLSGSGSSPCGGRDIVLTALLMGRGNVGTVLAVSTTGDGRFLGSERDREGDGRTESAGKGVL